MYCTIADLENALPENNLIQLTDDEDSGALHTARTESAISNASELIDGYLRGRYTLPLATTPAIIQRLAVDISIYYLYQRLFERDMPESMAERYKNALKLLDKIASGEISFATSEDTDAAPSQIRVNKTADDRLFTMDNLSF